MKLHITFVLTLILAFLIASCEEEKSNETPVNPFSEIDTIKPDQYFPIFPGSFWKYTNGYEMSTIDTYSVYIFDKYAGSNQPDHDSLILPILKHNKIYYFREIDSIYSYVNKFSLSRINSQSSYRSLPFYQMLDIEEKKQFSLYPGNSTSHSIGIVSKKDTSIIINSKLYEYVVQVYYLDEQCKYRFGTEECIQRIDYYAKSIGLIRRDLRNISENKTSVLFELIEYRIGK